MDIIIKNNNEIKKHDKHWQFCVGSCHAPMAHRVDYLQQLKFVYDDLV